MFRNFSRGWEMAKASWSVLKQHPKLALFPIFSGLATLAVLAAIIVPIITSINADTARAYLADGIPATNGLLIFAGLAACYFVAFFVIIFFNAALVYCALEAFAGREPSLRGGLLAAFARLPQILGWVLVASTVGLLLSFIQGLLRDRLGFIGALLGGVFETAWAVITYFVVPVLVIDGVGPIEAVKRSTAMLRKTWGETLGGSGGLGLIAFLFMLPVFAFGALIAFTASGRAEALSPALAWAIATPIVAYILALSVIFSALGSIFRTGAYIYATTGNPPTAMDRGMMQSAFVSKQRK